MTSAFNSNVFFESYIQSQVVRSTEKEKVKEEQMELELASLLKGLTDTLAQASSGGGEGVSTDQSSKSSSLRVGDSSSPLQPPSQQDLAQAIAAVAEAIATIQQQIKTGANAEYEAGLKVQLAQLQTVENMLINISLMEEYVKIAGPWAEGVIQFIINTYQPFSSDIFGVLVPNPLSIDQEIENFIKDTFGVDIPVSGISLSNDNTVLIDAIVSQAMSECMNSSVQQFYTQLTAINNPLVQALMQMLKLGGGISQQDIQALQAILAQIMNTLSQIANAETGNGSDAPSNTVVIEMLSMMAGMMNELQGEITKVAGDKAGSDVTIAQALIQQAQDALNKAIQAEEQIQKQEAAQKALNIFMKVIEAVVAVIISAVACAFGQFQIAAMVMVMIILQESGAMDKLTSAIAGAMVKDRWMNESQAKIVADVMVLVMTIVVTLGLGVLTGVSAAVPVAMEAAQDAAADAAEAGMQVAEEAEQEAVQAAEEAGAAAAENQGGFLHTAQEFLRAAVSRIVEILNRVNFFQRFSPLANLAITSGAQNVMETNLISDATVASLTAEKKDQSEIEKGQMIASIIGSIMMTLVSAGSMSGMTSGITSGTAASRVNWTRMMQNFSTFLRQNISANVLTGLYYSAQFGGTAIEAGAQGGLGITYVKQADAQREIGLEEGLANFFQELAKTTDNGLAATEKSVGNILKADEKIGSTTLQTMLAYEATFAQLFAQAV